MNIIGSVSGEFIYIMLGIVIIIVIIFLLISIFDWAKDKF